MKILDVFKLAILNIRSNLKMAICIIFGIIIIMQIVMVSSGYGYALNNYIHDIIENNASAAYTYSVFENFDKLEIEKILNNTKIEGIQTLRVYNIFEYCKDNNKTIDSVPLPHNNISIDAALIELDGNTYCGKNDFSYDFGIDNLETATRIEKIVKLEIGIIEPNENLQISDLELKEYGKKFDKLNPFIAGCKFTGKNQVIISDYMLEKFNINIDASECIGKTMNILVKTNDGQFVIIDSYEICGVLDSDFYRIKSRKKCPQILVSNVSNDYHTISHEYIFGNDFRDVVTFFNENEEIENMNIDIDTIEYAEIETLQSLFNEVVVVICGILLIAVVIFVYIVIYFYFKKRKRYVCIQRAIGMLDINLYALIFSELLTLEMIGITLSVPIYYGIVQVLNEIIGLVVSNKFIITKNDSYMAIAVACVLVLGMIIIISFVEYIKTKNYTIVRREKIF